MQLFQKILGAETSMQGLSIRSNNISRNRSIKKLVANLLRKGQYPGKLRKQCIWQFSMLHGGMKQPEALLRYESMTFTTLSDLPLLCLTRISSRCMWDADTDNYAEDVFMNVGVFGLVTQI